MRYTNGTETTIRLVCGDVRDASENFIVIGRDPDLKTHYESLTGSRFTKLPSWLDEFPVEFLQADNLGLSVFRTVFRPSGGSQRRRQEINRLQSAIEYPLARQIRKSGARQIALVPISCRAPSVVATGMIRIIWDISIAAFLNVSGPFSGLKPREFTIYCLDDLGPLIDVLDSGHYASMRHGWLFNTEVSCHRAKRRRYLARRKFKFVRTEEG